MLRQLQSGLEANRILLQSVSPHLARKGAKDKPPSEVNNSDRPQSNVGKKTHQNHIIFLQI